MEDINFNFSYVRPEKMTKFEIAILNGVISGSNDDIYAMELLEYLYRMNLVDKTFYQDFRERASKLNWNKPQLIEYLLLKIQPFCSLSTLINALRELGYHHISTELMKGLLLPKSSVERVNRNDMSNRKQVQQFFKMLKRKVWNAEFEEPLKTLRSMAVKLKCSMQAQTDPLKRQLLADRVVAVLGAEIDAHAITFDAELSEHDLFKELRDIVPQTTNTLVTDVILFERQANACAIGKYFSLGEKCLQRAKGCSAFMAPCLELANMVYCEVYVRLWEYEQNPKKAIRESLVKMAEIGIECLRDACFCFERYFVSLGLEIELILSQTALLQWDV